MIDRQDAEEIARQDIAAMSDRFVLLPEHTIEEPFGWVFFYNSREFVETGAFSSALAGNGPVLVLRESGEIRRFGTAYPLEHYLEPYRAQQ